jgi:WD40 repeat protein/energy-coupling factor transporter ATP-binding protein EcfA2
MTAAANHGAGGFPFQLDEFYLDLQEEGSKVCILSQEEISRRPFPGLRPFKTSEFQLFNGRVGQAEELIKRLKKNRFLAVIGSSGTGKSSLVRAGLIPQLFGGYLHGAGSKWNIAVCRPGKDPVENLAIALSCIKTRNRDTGQLLENFKEIEPQLSNSIYGLLEVKEMLDTAGKNEPAGGRANLLVIIDQFEELFRFDRKDLGKDNIENQFVNLLLKASLDPGNAVYVIITMRSEFLGDCVKYRGLPEAINEGQYLVPQLTRNELKEVIENPIRLAGQQIDPQLVELLVNEIEESKLKENLDQLPILQHALMRTYNAAMQEGPGTVIRYAHYKKIGEMQKALADHADAKFRELGDGSEEDKQYSKKQQLAKTIFQALTDMGTGQKGGRRPTSLKDIYAIAAAVNAGEKEVDEVVNHFRDSDTSFIMPPINTVLYQNLIADISHESLMRNWERLAMWMAEEMKYDNLYKQLNERRELHAYDPEEWVRGLLLRELLEWKESYANNLTWAGRHHQLKKKITDPAEHEKLYLSNLSFLNESILINEAQKEEEKRELQEDMAREQKIQSAKMKARVLTIAAAVSLLFGCWAFAEKSNARKQEIIANEQKKMADANARKAEALKIVAENSAAQARRNADSAAVQRTIAEEQRSIAEQKSALAYQQSLELKKYAELASVQRTVALQLRDSAVRKNTDFEKQLVKNALKNEEFYFSSALDQATKEAIIDSLFNTPSFDTRQIQLAKYIDLDILKLINDAVKAKENAMAYPTYSLQKAQEIWNSSQLPLIRELLLSIVNDNVFPGETVQVAPAIELNRTALAVSKKHSGFAFNNGRQLVTGKNENGRLLINENSFAVPVSNFFCNLEDTVYKSKPFSWCGYGDNDTAVALLDSFSVRLAGDGTVQGIATLPGLSNYVAAQLSPDGQWMVLADKDGNVSLKSTPRNREKLDTVVGNFRNRIAGPESIFFSPNSQYIYLNVEGRPRIINTKNVVTGMPDWSSENMMAATFTPDSRLLVALADGKISVRDSSMGNKKAGYREIDLTSGPFLNASVSPEKVNTLALSQNWKKLLLSQKNGRVYVLEHRNGDSLFSKTGSEDNLRVKEIGSSRSQFKAGFYNDSTIVAINGEGLVSRWPLYADFDDPATAIAAVMPQPAFHEKLVEGSVNALQVLLTGSTAELNIAAAHYYQEEEMDTAKMIYRQLLDEAPAGMRLYYLGKLTDVNNEINYVARINSSFSASKNELAAVQEYRSQRVARLRENTRYLEEQVQLCANNAGYLQNLSGAWGSLAYNQLFLRDFNGCILSAQKGLALGTVQSDWIYTNLALGYLLSGNYREAERIYSAYKDKMFSDGRMSFKKAFLDDLKELEASGVFTGLDTFVLKDIASIRFLLTAPAVLPPAPSKRMKG